MKQDWTLLLACLGAGSIVATATASNEDGCLVLHKIPVAYTDSQDFCDDLQGVTPPFVTNAVGTSIELLGVFATFPNGSAPRVAGVTFGLGYDDNSVIVADYGSCADQEVTAPGWPDPDTGTAIVFTTAQTSTTIPIYWFAAYSAYGEPALLELQESSHQGGVLGDDSVPAVLTDVSGFGAFGFNRLGYNPTADLATIEPEGWIAFRTHSPVDVSPPPNEVGMRPLDGFKTTSSALAVALEASTADALAKSFPNASAADTLGLDFNDDLVRLPDLSQYFRAYFADTTGMADLLADMRADNLVAFATTVTPELTVMSSPPEPPTPNDTYFDSVSVNLAKDAQWYLRNDEERSNSYCPTASADADIHLGGLSSWPQWTRTESVVGIADTGILNDHPDYDVVDEIRIPGYENDFCGSHGTKMAGLAASIANNNEGTAGVCPNCAVFDINLSARPSNLCTPSQNSISCANWASMIPAIGDQFLPFAPSGKRYEQTTLNMSFGCWGDVVEQSTALWGLWSEGIVVVQSAGNTPYPDPINSWPTSAGFVIGAGGYNYEGEFFDTVTNCNGTGSGVPVGKTHIDIAAPASGTSITTHNELAINNEYYALTNLQTSGAAAITSGAVSYLQGIHNKLFGSTHTNNWMRPETLVGIIRGTALPYASDPSDPGFGATCSYCPREYYGPGRLNVAGAKIIMDEINWAGDGQVYEEVVSGTDPGVAHTSLGPEYRYVDDDGTTWRLHEITCDITINTHDLSSDVPLPPRVAWAVAAPERIGVTNPNNTLMLVSGGDPEEITRNTKEFGLMSGARGASLQYVDPTDGSATLFGYLMEVETASGDVSWWPSGTLNDIQMTYYHYNSRPSSADDELLVTATPPRLTVDRNPTSDSVTFAIQQHEHAMAAEIRVFDASGRAVAELSVGDAGDAVTWNLRQSNGTPVPTGVYWATLDGDRTTAQRVVVVR